MTASFRKKNSNFRIQANNSNTNLNTENFGKYLNPSIANEIIYKKRVHEDETSFQTSIY